METEQSKLMDIPQYIKVKRKFIKKRIDIYSENNSSENANNEKCNNTNSMSISSSENVIYSQDFIFPEKNSIEELSPIKHVNKGTGAGGANTNLYGKKFEEKTNNMMRLLNDGYRKTISQKKQKSYDYYLYKTFEDKTIVFVLQNGLKVYMKNKYNIELFRCPDEAYIIEYNDGKKVIKILEKKEQNVEGSVETKLWAAPSLKREYELVLGEDYQVHYGLCVSDFLKQKFISNDKKYTILKSILNESNIALLFGDDDNYFEMFDAWLGDL